MRVESVRVRVEVIVGYCSLGFTSSTEFFVFVYAIFCSCCLEADIAGAALNCMQFCYVRSVIETVCTCLYFSTHLAIKSAHYFSLK